MLVHTFEINDETHTHALDDQCLMCLVINSRCGFRMYDRERNILKRIDVIDRNESSESNENKRNTKNKMYDQHYFNLKNITKSI